jgi:hypothetical protein
MKNKRWTAEDNARLHRSLIRQRNGVIIISVILALIIGFVFGMSYGLNIAMEQCIDAARILTDVNLKPAVKSIIIQFPQLMGRIGIADQEKLGLNSSEYSQAQLDKLNETLTKTMALETPRVI